MREVEQTVDIVPGLQYKSLVSINKFTEANYITVFTPDKVTIFDGEKASISSTQQPLFQGRRDPAIGLWRIPIEPEQTAPPKYTPTPQKSKNLSNHHMMINNVYELPST